MDRDPVTGKFLPGNKIARGRPPAEREIQMIDAFNESITKQDMIDFAVRLKIIALGKNPAQSLKAIEIILDRIMGKPLQSIDLHATIAPPDDIIVVREEVDKLKDIVDGEFKEEKIMEYLEERKDEIGKET